MTSGNHIKVAIGAWALTAVGFGLGADPAPFLAALVGGLLPDLDHPRSTLGRGVPWLAKPLARAMGGHRGGTHGVLATIGVVLLLDALGAPPPLAFAVGIGYASHVCADLLSRPGVSLLWPLPGRFCFPVLRGGSFLEGLLAAGLCLGALAWWWRTGDRLNEGVAWARRLVD